LAATITQRQCIHLKLKENEQKLKSLEQQMIHTQRLAAMGTMSCMVAHEFNNLLTPIINYSELALKHPDDAELVHKTLEKIIRQGNKAAGIVQSMLGLARDQSQHRSKVVLVDLLDDCFLCLARELSKDNIRTKIDISPELTIKVVYGQFQQVLLNLILNARQAMLPRPGLLTIKAVADDKTTRITIADTGCGIGPGDIDRIFEPFFTTKSKEGRPDQQGSGLGLMVCKSIIESHNGSLEVASTKGSGTTFTITLPRT